MNAAAGHIGSMWHRLAVVLLVLGVPQLPNTSEVSGQVVWDVEDVPHWQARELGRIPDIGRVSGAVSDNADKVYILEEGRVLVFRHDGTALSAIGRPGSGLGEFRHPEQIGLHGDTLWVHDHGQGRVTMFDLEGGVVGSFPGIRMLRFESGRPNISISAIGGVLRSDGMVHAEEIFGIANLAVDGPPPDSVDAPIVRLGRDGAVVDTVQFVRLYRRESQAGAGAAVPQNNLLMDPGPPTDTRLQVVLGDGAFLIERPASETAERSTFTVTRVSTGGDTIAQHALRYTPESWREEQVDEITRARGEVAIPAFQPPVTATVRGDDGSLWVRREVGREESRWVVVSGEGRPVGMVDLPEDATILWAAAGEVWVLMDPGGEDRAVVGFALNESPEGAG